jgi:hypothetical protein
VTYSYYLSAAFVITTQGYAQRENAKVGFYSDYELAASGGFAWTFNKSIVASAIPLDLPVGRGRDLPQLR